MRVWIRIKVWIRAWGWIRFRIRAKTSYFLQKVNCCDLGISKLRDNVSTSGMSSFS